MRTFLIGVMLIASIVGAAALGYWIGYNQSTDESSAASGDDDTSADAANDNEQENSVERLRTRVADYVTELDKNNEPFLIMQVHEYDFAVTAVVGTEAEAKAVKQVAGLFAQPELGLVDIQVREGVSPAKWAPNLPRYLSIMAMHNVTDGGFAVSNSQSIARATVPEQADAEVITKAANMLGHDAVTDLTVSGDQVPLVSVSYADETLTLRGAMPSEKAISKMLASVNEVFPTVDNQMVIDEGRYANLSWSVLGRYLSVLSHVPAFEIGVNEDKALRIRTGSIISFDSGSTGVTELGEQMLAKLAKNPYLSSRPMQIEGHTDSDGSEEFNMELSIERAQSVADILIKNGMPASHIEVSGKGESEPIADNSTEEGKSQNRRLVFVVLRPDFFPEK